MWYWPCGIGHVVLTMEYIQIENAMECVDQPPQAVVVANGGNHLALTVRVLSFMQTSLQLLNRRPSLSLANPSLLWTITLTGRPGTRSKQLSEVFRQVLAWLMNRFLTTAVFAVRVSSLYSGLYSTATEAGARLSSLKRTLKCVLLMTSALPATISVQTSASCLLLPSQSASVMLWMSCTWLGARLTCFSIFLMSLPSNLQNSMMARAFTGQSLSLSAWTLSFWVKMATSGNSRLAMNWRGFQRPKQSMLDQEMAGQASLNCQQSVPKLLGLAMRWALMATSMAQAWRSPLWQVSISKSTATFMQLFMQLRRVPNRLLCRSCTSSEFDSQLGLLSIVSTIVSHTGSACVPNSLLKRPTFWMYDSNSAPPAHTDQKCASPPRSSPQFPTPQTGEEGMQGMQGLSYSMILGMRTSKSLRQSSLYSALPQPQSLMPWRISLLPDHRVRAGQFLARRICCLISSSTFSRNFYEEGQMLSLNMKSQNSMMPFREANSRNLSDSYCPPPHTRSMLKCESTADSNSDQIVLPGVKVGFYNRGQNMSAGTQLAPLQQTEYPLTFTQNFLLLLSSSTVLMPKGILRSSTCCSGSSLKSLTTKSQIWGLPMPLGHQSCGFTMCRSWQEYFSRRGKDASILSSWKILAWQLPSSSLPGHSRATAKLRVACCLEMDLVRTQTQSILTSWKDSRQTRFHMPRVLRKGAQSQEYWQQALRVWAQAKGMALACWPRLSLALVELMTTSRWLLPCFRCCFTLATYFRNAFSVERMGTSLRRTSAQVSMPSNTSCWQVCLKVDSSTEKLREQRTEQSETHFTPGQFSFRKGSGISFAASRSRCRVVGMLVLQTLALRVAMFSGPSRMFICQLLASSVTWKCGIYETACESRQTTSSHWIINYLKIAHLYDSTQPTHLTPHQHLLHLHVAYPKDT